MDSVNAESAKGVKATLADVVGQYNRVLSLGLSAEQQGDLVEYLKSL